MRRFRQLIRIFVRNEDGPTAVEYAVMLALIVLVCFVDQDLGTNAKTTFTNIGLFRSEVNRRETSLARQHPRRFASEQLIRVSPALVCNRTRDGVHFASRLIVRRLSARTT